MTHLPHPPRPPPVDRGLARVGLGLGLGGEGGGVGGVRAVSADQNQQDESAKQCGMFPIQYLSGLDIYNIYSVLTLL